MSVIPITTSDPTLCPVSARITVGDSFASGRRFPAVQVAGGRIAFLPLA
jgi:hypothetical protein